MKSFLGLAAAGVLAASASAQTPPYVDPALRTTFQPTFQARAADAARALPLRLDSTLLLGGVGVQVAESPTVGVLVRLGNQGLAELQALGARIGSVRDGIATARIPVTAVQGLTALQGVQVVEAAHPVSITHDSSMNAIRVSDLRRLVGSTWTGLTGTGVIVAMYDTGLDFRHDDFIAPDGTTRVLGLWDQTRTGTPPAGFGYGNYCSRDAIQQAIAGVDMCGQADLNGHGTHTTGSAAGDGSAAGSGTAFQYAGVAPGAELLIVKGGNATFTEDQILDGLRWLEAEGRRLNRPMVVNLSLGGQFGAHDGRRLYEQGIDALARPGFVVVTTSGNEGSNGNTRNLDGSPTLFSPDYIHASGFPVAGSTREFTIDIPQYFPLGGTCNDVIALSFWYEGADRLQITVRRPDGSTVSSATGERNTDDATTGSLLIDNAEAGPHPLNGDHEALILISDCSLGGAPPVSGTYTIRVSTLTANSGRPYHMWMYFNSIGGFGLARAGIGFDNRYIVASPGSALTTVTVGAFVSRVCWPSSIAGSGNICYVEVEDVGDLARFSAAGPTRDDRLKPEITAPGLAVVSSLSGDANPGSNRIVPDGVHWANQGTSMAAPHVTGAIALLMQNQPSLTSDAVKTVFSQTAAHDAFTSRVYGDDVAARPENWWGYGKLDVFSAACEFGLGGGLGQITLTPRTDTLPTGATVQLRACGSDRVIAFQSTRPDVARVDANGLVSALAVGVTQIIASGGALADTAEIAVVPPAIVALSGASPPANTPVLSSRTAVLSLLRLGLEVRGVEAMRIHSLTFVVSGADPGARLIVAQDLDANGKSDATDRPLSSGQRGANLDADTIRLAIPDLTIAAHESINLIVGLELSGNVRNASEFRVDLVPDRTETTGVRSGAENRVDAAALIASAPVLTTVLTNDAPFSLSENPVRSSRVIFNFRERPSTAAIYTLTGRRVLDILPRISSSGFFEWDLRNSEGARIAPGVYLLVFSVAGTVIREKLFVLGAGPGSNP